MSVTGVKDGYPVTTGPNRASATPDADAQVTYYYDLGTTDAGAQAAEFQALYGEYTAFKGMGPKAAYDAALRALGINPADIFVYYTDDDHG